MRLLFVVFMSFALCNMYVNGAVTDGQYFSELQELRKTAASLIAVEILFLEKITIDPIGGPVAPPPPQTLRQIRLHQQV